MAMLSRLFLLTLVVTLVNLFYQPVQAGCPLVVSTPALDYLNSKHVFIGTVTEFSLSGTLHPIEIPVKFSVKEAFKGVNGSEISLKTLRPDHCGYIFIKGETYLVYANDAIVNFSRTRHIKSAAEDLDFLRNAVPNIIISENFNDPTDNFIVVKGGQWSVKPSQYELANPANAKSGNGNISVHKTTITGDFTLMTQALVKPTTTRWDDFSIIFNYQDQNNYYYASFSESNDGGVHGIFRVLNGRVRQIADFSGKINADRRYNITIKRSGDKISVQLLETYPTMPTIPEFKIEAEVTDNNFKNGKVGFGSKNNAASFDSLIVYNPKIDPVPTAPKNLKAKLGVISYNCGTKNEPIHLTWDTSPGATSYNVKKSKRCDGVYETIATKLTDTFYDDPVTSTLSGGCYIVTAVNEAGESQPSDSAPGGVLVADCFPPQLLSIDPTSGPVGTKVTLQVNLLTPGILHKIHFSSGVVKEFIPDSSPMTFEVPASIDPVCRLENPPCGAPSIVVQPGTYNVTISNKYGSSSPLPFNVTQ
jgi:hypothetical protein